MFALVLLAGCGGGSGEDAVVTTTTNPAIEQAVASAAAALSPVGEGGAAAQVLGTLGPPDAFVVTFEAGPGGATQRRETWSYLELATAVELVDGDVLAVQPLEPLAGPAIAPIWYDPLAFQPGTTVDDVRSMLTDPAALVSTEAPPELGVDLTVYAGDQLLVAFDATGLVYAETVPLAVGAGS